MRDILFRGKRKDNGEWIEGYYAIQSNHACFAHELKHQHFIFKDVCLDFNLGGLQNFEVIPETVGQYTGLTDKDGKKIFEGDIVVCKQAINGNLIDYYVEIGFVEMKYGAFGLHRKQGYYRPFKDWLEDYEYEVIGKIHDNPELLKEGDESDT